MMIMAQHPQQQIQQTPSQQQQKQHNATRIQQQLHKQQANEALLQQQQQQQQPQAESVVSQQQQYQLELDGKRAIIKNQLYLIEQLQLENANLRNERDQLQLENEELKFQLQMISSSNILLNQPNAAFNDQQMELVAHDGKINGNQLLSASGVTVAPATVTTPKTTTLTSKSVTSTTAINLGQHQQHQVRLLATPLRQPATRHNGESKQLIQDTTEKLVQVRSLALNGLIDVPTTKTHEPSNHPATSTATAITTNVATGSLSSGDSDKSLLSGGSKLVLASSSSSTLTATNVDKNNTVPQSRSLPHDDEEHRVKLVEQCYGGDSEQVQAAAIVIQRAFRKYQICKRFRTITEQLRHTHSGAERSSARRAASDRKSSSDTVPYSSANNANRVAAWESLSYAASRLAASAAGALAAKQSQQTSENNIKTTKSLQQQEVSSQPQTVIALSHQQQQQHHHHHHQQQQQQQQQTTKTMLTDARHQKQDPVVAAAINFQQLESIRKRQYRVGLNIFNKSPEKGVSFLVAHSFIDSSSPYMKTSTSYYHSNQLHFIDKQHLVHQQQQRQSSPIDIQSCQLCLEEENLKRNIAHFLLHRKGLAKERIGQYLGNLQAQFNQDVLKYYLQELDFYGLQIDLALRKFLSTFRLPGEAQKIEKIVDCFAQRYVQCQQQQQLVNNNGNVQLHNNQLHMKQQQQSQPSSQILSTPTQTPHQQQRIIQNNHQLQHALNYKNNLILLSKDEIFILTFAIIMLNTDLHSPSLKPTSRMSATQFVNNLRGVFKSQTINESDLIEIYERVKANQITTTPDHVTHVMKVQQGLTVTNFQKKELPNLCVPHRRLVCFCRLFEVYDVNKKERLGQHQREIFLFNDLLLVTKLARRVRANANQLYTYRQSISLQGLYVQLFQSTHYNFGIRLCQRSNDETIIMFNARNELDQSRFVDDLGESIAEMDEMETIKTNNIIDTIHFKYLERLQRHAMMHNTDDHVPSLIDHHLRDEIHPQSKLVMKDNDCDTLTSNKQISALDEPMKQQSRTNPVFNPSSVSTVTTAGNNTSAPNTLATICVGRVPAKFSSMLNLSSVASARHNDVGDNDTRRHQIQTKYARQNQLFVNQQSQRVIKSGGGVRDEQAMGTQRRCSTSSVHSLDSGLFLSRDVSPNQSS